MATTDYMYEPRTMLAVVSNITRPKTFIKDLLFRNTTTVGSEKIDVDIIKNDRRVSPFVSPIREGQVVEREGYKTDTYEAPLLKPKMITTADQVAKRLPGEGIYSSKTPEERAEDQLIRDYNELDSIIARTEELMCCQAVFEGKVTIKGDGVDALIDFNMTNKEALVGDARWSEATSTPLKDLERMKSQILKTGRINPDVAIFGKEALALFMAHEGVQKMFDLRLVETGQIDPRDLPNGATYIGHLKSPSLDIYTYEEWYLDGEAEEEKSVVPENMVWMGSTNARTDFVYAGIWDADLGWVEQPRFAKTWTKKDPSARILQMIARPLPIPQQIDSMFVMTVD